MQSTQVPIGEWFKVNESDPGFDGVEVKFSHDRTVQVRDSRARGTGPTLEFPPQAWEAFLRGVRRGEFDQPPVTMFDPARCRPATHRSAINGR